MKKTITTILLGLLLTTAACVTAEEGKETDIGLSDEIINESIERLEGKEEVSTEDKSGQYDDYEQYMACDNNKFPFQLDEVGGGHGQFVFTGMIIEELEQAYMGENELIPVIRIEVNDTNSPEAMEYYKGMVDEGNGINNVKNEKLRFRIGTLKNEEFSSTAKISETTLDSIFEALESKQEISLTFTQAFLPGMGAPLSVSFACEITE